MNHELVALLESALAMAKGEPAAGVTPAPLTYEGKLSPELLAIQYYRPGTDYAGRPTKSSPGRAPAIPSQLDEVGQYNTTTWVEQNPPVAFMDYLLMLHDLVPSLTDDQRFSINAGRWSAANHVVVPTGINKNTLTYLELADRWLFPEKYQTEEDKAKAAALKAEWDAVWAEKLKRKQEQEQEQNKRVRAADGLYNGYDSIQQLVDDAKAVSYRFAIAVNGGGVYPGFDPIAQFTTVGGKVTR